MIRPLGFDHESDGWSRYDKKNYILCQIFYLYIIFIDFIYCRVVICIPKDFQLFIGCTYSK
jgi:hypothetical protein